MEGILIACVIVGWFGILLRCLSYVVEKNSIISAVIGIVVLISCLGSVIQFGIERNRRGPCVMSEIQMHYNSATETVMPAEVCVERGKWIK